ncbi:MAG: HAMP domain-containing histidine kinase [Proteobacteria bacterium]|nr:HAMP domain-containing histidine kinase [Pseudomonadota bacterium]
MARRTSLWAEVVLNLALLTVVTIALNAVLVGKVVQGREVELRADVASDLSRVLALGAADVARRAGPPNPAAPGIWKAALQDAEIPDGEPFFAVLATRDLRAVAAAGDVPDSLRPDTADGPPVPSTWLVDGTDLRASLTGERTERGRWQPNPSLFRPAWSTATSPVIDDSGHVIGAIRVAVPVGAPLFGPWNRQTVSVLALSALLGATVVGAFGFVLFRRRILGPLETLAAGTAQVARGEFDVHVDEGAHDEFGALADRFNAMAEGLQRYKKANEDQLAELRAINADLTQAREDLIFAEKMATVGRLAAGVAHEVGNPLASVLGFVELLQNDEDGELAADLLPRIRAELDRIHRIIRDLLNYSRPTGMTHDQLEPIDVPLVAVQVADVISVAQQLVIAQPRFANVAFDIELGGDPVPELTVPADRLQQVLLNLFVNAAEAMEGKGAIVVRRLPDEEPGLLTLSVADEGPGIDPRAGSNIYEPFFTTKEVGAGTGLGLAVSLRLVERMGGRLRHVREHPGGACFHLSLPNVEAGA